MNEANSSQMTNERFLLKTNFRKNLVILITQKKNSISSSIKPEAEQLSWRFWRKRRYIVVLMAFLGFVSNYSLRVNLSVAIVAMTENRTIYYENGTIGYVCSVS